MVVFCSFLCIAVIDGVGYTTGKQTVFFPEKIACILEHSRTYTFAGLLLNPLVTDLRSGKAEISFAGSLQVGPRSQSLCKSSTARHQVGIALHCNKASLLGGVTQQSPGRSITASLQVGVTQQSFTKEQHSQPPGRSITASLQVGASQPASR